MLDNDSFLKLLFLIFPVLQIADQLINRVNTLHEKSIIHRDIKPVSEGEIEKRR